MRATIDVQFVLDNNSPVREQRAVRLLRGGTVQLRLVVLYHRDVDEAPMDNSTLPTCLIRQREQQTLPP